MVSEPTSQPQLLLNLNERLTGREERPERGQINMKNYTM